MVHLTLLPGPTALSFCHFHSIEESVSPPDFHLRGVKKRVVWGASRDGDSWGGKCRF